MAENILKIPTMFTINEVAKRTGLAKFHVRQLALKNKVKNIRTGKKILINFEKFIEYLNKDEEQNSNVIDIQKIDK